MRMNRFIYALGIGCMLSACSTQDELSLNPNEEQDYIKSNKYVTISIVTPNNGTRSDDDQNDTNFTDGESKEYDVNDVAFYFFDRQGNYAHSAYFDKASFAKTTDFTNEDPQVTSVGTVEVELAANSVYHDVVAILNPNQGLFTTQNGKVLQKMTKSQLETYNSSSYATKANLTKGDKGNFTMANSVFIDGDYNGKDAFELYKAVPISSSNIYVKTKPENEMTQTERDELKNIKEAAALKIYVERVNAKVTVPKAPVFTSKDGAYVVNISQDGTQSTTITVKNLGKDENGNYISVDTTITVIPVFKGIGLSVTPHNAYLLKNIASDVTYSFIDNKITNFQWNDQQNKRTYWESTTNLGQDKGYDYNSWNDIKSSKTLKDWATWTAYTTPNTAEATVPQGSDDNDNKPNLTTKLMVSAQLTYKYVGAAADADAEPLKLVKYSDGYWMRDYFIFNAQARAIEELSEIVYPALSETDLSSAKAAVAAIKAENLEGKINLVIKNPGSEPDELQGAYLAKLELDDKDLNLVPTLTANHDAINKLVIAQIKTTLDNMTQRQIQYWKDGQTYFYVPIRHEGFTGLVGGKDGNYLNGVVRNHMYSIEIEGIYGLGTPVIDPTKPIDPERPDDAPKSYMTAKIHVLKWRVVDSKVTLH